MHTAIAGHLPLLLLGLHSGHVLLLYLHSRENTHQA